VKNVATEIYATVLIQKILATSSYFLSKKPAKSGL